MGKINAKNGSTKDFDDFDGNHITDEIMASSYKSNSYSTIVEEWKDTVEKFVKSYRDETWNYNAYTNAQNTVKWVSETTVNAYSEKIDAEANLRATYQYRVSFDMGLPTSDIVFADVLEKALDTQNNNAPSAWQGKLLSIDFSYVRSLGLIPTVYYSTEDKLYTENRVADSTTAEYTNNLNEFTKSAVTGDIWTAPDDIDIRSIAVHLDTAGAAGGSVRNMQLYFLLNMQAPEKTDGIEYGAYAVNEHKVFYTSQTSVSYKRMELSGDIARVRFLPSVSLLTMIKVDGQDEKKPLEGAAYTFYRDPEATEYVTDWEGNITAKDVTSDKFGEVIIDTLEPGTYYYKETSAPQGYMLDLDENGNPKIYEIVLEGPDKTYLLENGYNSDYVKKDQKLTGTIVFTKKDADDDTVTGLKGAVYALYEAEGAAVYTDENNVYQESGGTKNEFTTDNDGKFTITGLPWGNYYLTEVEPPAGYELNNAKVWVNISKTATEKADQELHKAIYIETEQKDEEKTASVRLIKYDRDGATPLANAWFRLLRQQSDGNWETVDGYDYIKTAANGYVTATDLKFGIYRFEEINPPVGYEMPVDEERFSDDVTLNASTVSTIQTVTKKNERILGKATLRKISDDDIPLNGARFDLYKIIGVMDDDPARPEGDPVDALIYANLITNPVDGQDGMISVNNLDWGEYYFKEISSPSGYEKTENKQFTVTAENAAVGNDINGVINTRKKGEVILNKTAGAVISIGSTSYSKGDPIEGAEFALYTADGERVYVTYDNGTGKYSVCDKDADGSGDRLVTDSDGKIDVDNISWGAYYFEETKAPEGLALAEKVRFTVNAASCLSVQELECEDFAMKCLITIEKEIDEKLAVFGEPTFIFRIRKLDASDGDAVLADYTTMITLKDDMKSGYTTVQVDAGKYRVEEIPVYRYQLNRTEYVTAETTVPEGERFIDADRVDVKPSDGYSQPGKAFVFTLSATDGVPHKARVKFTNHLEEYSGISHTDALTNIIPSKRKITGFSLQYKDGFIPCVKTVSSMIELSREDMTGTINYDDGTTRPMTPEEINAVLNVTSGAGDSSKFTMDIGFGQAGQTTGFTASYIDSETSKTYKTNFYVTVGPYQVVETQRVVYRTDKDNSCVFPDGKKRYSVNTVYYNDNTDGTAKTAVSGHYIAPEMIGQQRYLTNWEIVSGMADDIGKKLAPTEQAVTDYLAEHYVDGLRELEVRAVVGNPVYNFEYTGEIQTFTAPSDGIYYIEGWGAQGGASKGADNYPVTNPSNLYDVEGGRGGYSYGYVYLHEGDEVYIAVGGEGSTLKYEMSGTRPISIDGGFNGGGTAVSADNSGNQYIGSGGGATHFALTMQGTGLLSDYESVKDTDVLLVAGGGGGSDYYQNPNGTQYWHHGNGGYGGGETGGGNTNHASNLQGTRYATGGSQTSGGTFSGTITSQDTNGFVGYFGRGTNDNTSTHSGGGGGSGYCNKAVLTSYSNIAGDQSFPDADGNVETGHEGNGYAKITYLNTRNQELFYLKTSDQNQLITANRFNDTGKTASDKEYWIELPEYESGTDLTGQERTYVFGYSVYLKENEVSETLFDYIQLKNILQYEVSPTKQLNIQVQAFGIQTDQLEGIEKDSGGEKALMTQADLTKIYSYISGTKE